MESDILEKQNPFLTTAYFNVSQFLAHSLSLRSDKNYVIFQNFLLIKTLSNPLKKYEKDKNLMLSHAELIHSLTNRSYLTYATDI